MLVPVIGIVQVGSQAMADRYMYLPIIGIFLAMTWAIGETVAGDQGSEVRGQKSEVRGLRSEVRGEKPEIDGQETEVTVGKAKFRTRLLGAAGLAAVVCCAVVTFKQVRVWQDDVRLFTHALKVTKNNGAAHFNLGTALGKLGKLDEAIAQFQRAVAASPGYAAAYYNLGFAYLLKGAPGDAVAPLERATTLDPGNAAAQQKLGSALLAIGRIDEASFYFKEALQNNPADAESRAGLGRILAGRGNYSEAASQFSEAVRLAPQPENYFNLGVTLSLQGLRNEAAQRFRDTLQHAPDHVGALNELAWLLATSPEPELRDGQEAVRNAARAAQLTGNKQPMVLGTLAAAYAESGQFEEAAKTARTARDLAEAAGMKAVAEKNSELAELYAKGKPYRQSASPPAGTPSKADP
jgi:tetratricopeptide (TPR) repeat protein